MEFSKYEATANDFIMVDRTRDAGEPGPSADTVIALCDRRRGVGADGVILILPSKAADVAMRIINADGSEAEMCGNGLRALLLFAHDRGILNEPEATVETASGIKTVRRETSTAGEDLFTVNMGSPAWMRADVPMSGEGEAIGVPLDLGRAGVLKATCVSMGNPHCVFFIEAVDGYPVADIGALVESDPLFPERTNVEFVELPGDGNLRARVWERGVGETMACGTGACASLVAAHLNGLSDRKAVVSLPGGDLTVEWMEDGVLLTGPARHVFDGTTLE